MNYRERWMMSAILAQCEGIVNIPNLVQFEGPPVCFNIPEQDVMLYENFDAMLYEDLNFQDYEG